MSAPKSSGRPRVTVLWHSDLRDASAGRYLIKEVWGSYIEEALAPLARKLTVVASLAESHDAKFQEYLLSHPAISVVPLNGRRTANRLRRTLKNLRDVAVAVHDGDVIWVFMPAWKGVYGAVVARLLRRPVVSYFGIDWVGVDESGRLSNAVRALAQRIVVALSETVLVADDHQLHRYESQRPGRTLRRVPAMHLSSSLVWRRRNYELAKPPTILFVGSVGRRKGIDVLLDVARILIHERQFLARFLIVGPVHPNVLEQFGSQTGERDVRRWVEFAGYVQNGPELYDLMKRADALVLPSRSEGFPRVLYEAMAHGLPIVASRVGSIDLVMSDQKDCMLIEPGDPVGLADAVERLMLDEGLRRKLAEEGYRTFDREIGMTAPEQVAYVMEQVSNRVAS